MRISDDHDEARAVARYGMNGALAASALMFTLDGVPLHLQRHGSRRRHRIRRPGAV